MSVHRVASGRWVAQLPIGHRKKVHLGTFDTEAEARAAKADALAARPPEPAKPWYLVEDRGYQTPCWVWQRAKASNGYGTVVVDGEQGRVWRRAHRHFYEQRVGPIPDGHQLDHLCRVRACVN